MTTGLCWQRTEMFEQHGFTRSILIKILRVNDFVDNCDDFRHFLAIFSRNYFNFKATAKELRNFQKTIAAETKTVQQQLLKNNSNNNSNCSTTTATVQQLLINNCSTTTDQQLVNSNWSIKTVQSSCMDCHLASSSLLRLYMSKTEDGIPNVIRTNALTVGSTKVSKVLQIVMKKTWKRKRISKFCSNQVSISLSFYEQLLG